MAIFRRKEAERCHPHPLGCHYDKLRMIAEEHIKEDFIIMNGNRVLFKRQKFEKFLDNATVV